LDPGKTTFFKKQVISDKEFREAVDTFGAKSFRAGMGAEAIKELLEGVDLETESKQLKDIVGNSVGQKRIKAIRRSRYYRTQ
jgi:DNA-directed RNA polymerase subunit beta'